MLGRGQINPATNFGESNAFVSVAARTGLLAAFPEPLYEVAQVWLDVLRFMRTLHFLGLLWHFLKADTLAILC